MSSSQEYKYIIKVDPDDLNKIEEYMKMMGDITTQPDDGTTKGPSALSETDLAEIMEAIRGISGSSYSSTYTYDDEKQRS